MNKFSGPREWGRLLTAMITPFHADGAVNYGEVVRLARFLVEEQRNDGIVVNGTTGESPTLSEEEKLRILDTVLDTVGDKAAVLFGSGSYDTRESIRLTREGQRCGAHGIMLVTPYYSRPNQAGLYAHFAAISNETSLPVLIYNIQPRSAVNLETATLMKLVKDVSNIVAVKEASGSMPQIQDVCAAKPDYFRVYSGDDALTLPVLSVGGHGIVSVAGHVVGSQIKQLLDAFPSDIENARKIHLRLLPVYKAIFAAPNPSPIKYATSLIGFDSERVRLPLVPLTAEEKRGVELALENAGVRTSVLSR